MRDENQNKEPLTAPRSLGGIVNDLWGAVPAVNPKMPEAQPVQPNAEPFVSAREQQLREAMLEAKKAQEEINAMLAGDPFAADEEPKPAPEWQAAAENMSKADGVAKATSSFLDRSAALAGMTMESLSGMIRGLTSELQRDMGIQVPKTFEQDGTFADPAVDTVPADAAVEPAAAEETEQAEARRVDEEAVEPQFDFDRVWQVADEPVEWTEVLTGAYPPAGIYDEIRDVLREKAEAVLKGDTDAYVDVIAAARPLDDLLTWATAVRIDGVDADHLKASFTGNAAYAGDDSKRYMAGLALRIARDLFALLPVCEVQVDGVLPGWGTISVGYERKEMQKVVFAFVDPVSFAEQTGAVFAEEEAD